MLISEIIHKNKAHNIKTALYHLRDDNLLTGPLIGSAGIALHTGDWHNVNDIDILGPIPDNSVQFDEKYERGYLTNFYKTDNGMIEFEYLPFGLKISGKHIPLDTKDVIEIDGIKVLGLEQLKNLKSMKND